MRRFIIALQFLTIFPVKIRKDLKKEDFGKSLIYFPFSGMLIGLFLVLILYLFAFLPHLVTIAIVLIASIVITGGMHLDGFADTCDGFYAGRSKEEILAIMRDSRIGTMGVIGIFCLLLLKFALLASIQENILWKPLIMMPLFARWAQLFLCYISKYAREEGKARFFIEYADRKSLILGSIFSVGIFLLLTSLRGLILFFLSTLAVILFMYYVKRRLGGMTGDTIGAASEIAEVALLLSFVVCENLICLY